MKYEELFHFLCSESPTIYLHQTALASNMIKEVEISLRFLPSPHHAKVYIPPSCLFSLIFWYAPFVPNRISVGDLPQGWRCRSDPCYGPLECNPTKVKHFEGLHKNPLNCVPQVFTKICIWLQWEKNWCGSLINAFLKSWYAVWNKNIADVWRKCFAKLSFD